MPCAAQRDMPSFYTGQDYGASLYISIKPQDFTLERLVHLAQALRLRRPEQKNFGVFFFSSDEAASYFQPPVEGLRGTPLMARQFHAYYSFEEAKHEESLSIMPLGYYHSLLETKMDVPLVGKPHCRLEIQSRCLISALNTMAYPSRAISARASGRIVLAGMIERDGGVAGIHIDEVDVRPDKWKSRLASAAMGDLRTWHFDAGSRTDNFRITYSYFINPLLPKGGTSEEWIDPNEVRVGANPPK